MSPDAIRVGPEAWTRTAPILQFLSDCKLPDLTLARDAPRAIGPMAIALALAVTEMPIVGRTGQVRAGMDRAHLFGDGFPRPLLPPA